MTLLKILLLVTGIVWFFRTRLGDKISDYLPTPFWVYFLSIVSGTVGFLPHESPVYTWLGLYGLSAALLLMLVGTPITHLIKMGPKALTAMISSIVTMLAATFLAYVLVMKWLPDEGWKAAGALLGTWIGGSANMLAVKSILNLSDAGYAPLIIVDTVMSYGWMALLIGAAPHQEKINRWLGAMTTESSPVQGEGRVGENTGTPRVFKKTRSCGRNAAHLHRDRLERAQSGGGGAASLHDRVGAVVFIHAGHCSLYDAVAEI
jgi:uncharacterized membrane protein